MNKRPETPELSRAELLTAVLATPELALRPSRPPDHAAENRALVTLATAMAENPAIVLRRLARFARELCGAESAGVSVPDTEGPAPQFRWQAVDGRWAEHEGRVQPRPDSLFELVLDRDGCVLARSPERHFTALRDVTPPAVEMLLVPFHHGNRPVGAVWIVTHTADRRFDGEDARVLGRLARFASAAYTTAERAGNTKGLRQERLAALNLMEDAIAARHEMERATGALRASEERLLRMVNIARVGVLTYDLGGTMLHANDAFLEMLGYSRGEFEARRWSWRDFMPPEQAATSERVIGALRTAGRGGPYEREFVAKAGTRLWLMSVAANPGDGTLVEYAIDISGRKRAEEALRAREEQFRRAIEEAPIPIIMYAEDGRVLQISRTWTELTGYTPEDIPTFDAWLSRAYGDDADLLRERMRAVFDGQAVRQQFELQVLTRTGERRDWELTISAPGRLVDGRRFAVGMVNDMTERMRAERELRLSEERLREADRRKNHFLAMLGHELRNPLAAIRGGVALLRSDRVQPATRARTLPIVADQVAHMERLVDDLLDVTRIVTGRVQLRQENLTVQEVLAGAIETLDTRIRERGFELRLRAPAEPLPVLGDRVRLNQVLVNVLGNAMKYSGDARRIDVALSREGGFATISVRDYGVGISPEFLPRMFDPFMQAKPTLTLDEGLGLGLAVVRQLVDLHGGSVDAFSAGEGQGSELVIRLPVAAEAK